MTFLPTELFRLVFGPSSKTGRPHQPVLQWNRQKTRETPRKRSARLSDCVQPDCQSEAELGILTEELDRILIDDPVDRLGRPATTAHLQSGLGDR